MEAPYIPDYIKRDLRIIDPLYFFEWDEASFGWFVRRRMLLDRNKLFIRNPRVGYYKDLDEAILGLKIRKREGLKSKGQKAELDEIKRRNKEAKERRRQDNYDFMADGLMFGYRMGSRKTYDMGGKSP